MNWRRAATGLLFSMGLRKRMTTNGDLIVVEVRQYGERWWVCLGSKRIVGLDKRDAGAVAYQIVVGLKELGFNADMVVAQAETH